MLLKEEKIETDQATVSFIESLRNSEFQGDIEDSYGARIVASTDNSVYQVIPEAIIYPRTGDDINHVVKLLSTQTKLSIVARGGATGTNGQSLNGSLVLDTSRHLNNIIELDIDAMQVVVEPGVVLDQLNARLAEHGLFFPPDVSSSTRATLGGMVATDASGKGSRVYGKTSDYIEKMDVVLSDGTDFCVQKQSLSDVSAHESLTLAQKVQSKVHELIKQHKEEISKVFPKMNRGLTGYNLEKVVGDNDDFQLSYLLAGSEGTLALSKKLTLRVIKKPKLRALVAVFYSDLDRALEHIPLLLEANPTAIEVLDDKILQMAQQDVIWQSVESAFEGLSLSADIKGLNFIEVTGDSSETLEKQCQMLDQIIHTTGAEYGVITSLVERNPEVITALWGIRKRAVGLLGAIEGDRRPMAFVEDTAVSPEQLPAYVKKFRAILDKYDLDYGMFGHADVGCLHVRPALDMRQAFDQTLFRSITDEIASLTKEYGGLLWGEHGRGYRGEYSPLFFGEKLYPVLRQIKGVFDPNNILNPGKLATPTHSKSNVTAIDEAPMRGQFDIQISDEAAGPFDSALHCNGNGACFSWDTSEAMCPSYKATRDRRFSPKGRAAMLREWLRLSEIILPSDKSGVEKLERLEAELYESLNACLSCKSCTHSCPIKVDIPDLKSKFLQKYHQNKGVQFKRKPSDFIFSKFEGLAAIGRKAPQVTNVLVQNPVSQWLLKSAFSIVKTPRFSSSLQMQLRDRNAKFISPIATEKYKDVSNAVILLPDSFNASYNAEILVCAYDLLTALGYTVLVAPVFDNGKAFHVKGYLNEFKTIAENHAEHLEALAQSKLPLLSVEVVTRMMHSKEYVEVLKRLSDYKVWSIESWLCGELKNQRLELVSSDQKTKAKYQLLPHCMEQTADKQSSQDWQELFSQLGLDLMIENAGCCGMSGLFGHEADNEMLSETIFKQHWKPRINNEFTTLASGFSCRCQLKDNGNQTQHPIEVLASMLV